MSQSKQAAVLGRVSIERWRQEQCGTWLANGRIRHQPQRAWYEDQCIIVPKDCTGGGVVRQGSYFTADWDEFLDADANKERDDFAHFIQSQRPGAETVYISTDQGCFWS